MTARRTVTQSSVMSRSLAFTSRVNRRIQNGNGKPNGSIGSQ
uniref:Uncharacterized protein n=1 Tax=Anguilla anguilla TaxID=7936 RepID=A0A0E9VZ92_ANGAN